MRVQNAKLNAVKSMLRPVVGRANGTSALELVPGHLSLSLVLRTPHGDLDVGEADLKRWDATFEEAWTAAMENLALLSPRRSLQQVATVPGMGIYASDDAASRALVLTELIHDFPLEGVLFSVPTEDQLLIVPLRDFEHVQVIDVLVNATRNSTLASTRPLSDQIFWTDGAHFAHIRVTHDGASVDIHPPPELLAAVERLAAMSLSMLPMAAEA